MRVRAQEYQHKTDSTNNIVLYFKIDGAILDSTYMGNNESLKKLDELIKNELIIPNLDSITIVASSSPDGKEAYNLELSRKRAESVKAYITGKYPEIKKELVYARYTGENWVDFKRMIETDKNIPHRERLINIINSDRENGAKEWLIKTLANGESWRYIRKNFLPQLRTGAVCVIYYKREPVKEEKKEEPKKEDYPSTKIGTGDSVIPLIISKPLFAETNLLDVLSAEPRNRNSIGKQWSVAAEGIFPWWKASRRLDHYHIGYASVKYWLGIVTQKKFSRMEHWPLRRSGEIRSTTFR
ncbi:MAG: OmpA family protein [Butyricimonas paravirosa]